MNEQQKRVRRQRRPGTRQSKTSAKQEASKATSKKENFDNNEPPGKNTKKTRQHQIRKKIVGELAKFDYALQ